MALPSKTLTIQIEENTYNIKFPTVRQFLAIENLRMSLTDEKYGSMAFSTLKSTAFAIDIVDAVSAFFTLIPTLRDDLDVKNFMDLDPFKAKIMISVYKQKFLPWYNAWMNELTKEDDIKVEEPTNESAEI
jgi:hypothetical protein